MEGPVVDVKQGKLRGTIAESIVGGTYIAFRGIPYATPPLGELRFKDPEAPESWSGIRDASKEAGHVAMQINELPPNDIIGGEDCLYLSVYTSSVTGRKPVIVWIHGGGFSTGTERHVRPDYLMEKDVVLVCINYRVGALGFLNLGHEVASGNQGLKDQVAALKWVKENISNFGGDPNNVTACGASAGGASVHFLAISPLAKGLIHKGVLLSGTATCPWALTDTSSKLSFRIAELLGNNSDDPVEVIKFLRSVPAEKIVELQSQVLTPSDTISMRLPFGPCVDDKSKNPLLPQPVNKLLANDSNIPFLIGHAAHEFIMFMKDSSDKAFEKYDKFFGGYLKSLALSGDKDKVECLTRDMKNHYFHGKTINREQAPELVQFLSDIYFVNEIKELAINRCKRNATPTYLYRFSYVGNQKTASMFLVKNPVMTGASHVDDVRYIFHNIRFKESNYVAPAVGTKDRTVIERMTRMLTNFAKTGDPTSKLDEYVTTVWKPVTKDNFNFLDIDSDVKNLPIDTVPLDMFQKYA